MNILESILSSRARAAIFTILFGMKQGALHNREIARRSGLSEAAIRQELCKLTELGLVIARKDGNRVYYSANKSNPLFREIHSMVLKTTGLVDTLVEALADPRIEFAFVFGSIAESSETPESDIDLLIIGSIGFRDVTRMLSGVSEKLDREINPMILSREEYIKRRRADDHFAHYVIDGARLFIKGDANEFEAMGK